MNRRRLLADIARNKRKTRNLGSRVPVGLVDPSIHVLVKPFYPLSTTTTVGIPTVKPSTGSGASCNYAQRNSRLLRPDLCWLRPTVYLLRLAWHRFGGNEHVDSAKCGPRETESEIVRKREGEPGRDDHTLTPCRCTH